MPVSRLTTEEIIHGKFLILPGNSAVGKGLKKLIDGKGPIRSTGDATATILDDDPAMTCRKRP